MGVQIELIRRTQEDDISIIYVVSQKDREIIVVSTKQKSNDELFSKFMVKRECTKRH